jgi:glucosamine-6-phosphate deaminase
MESVVEQKVLQASGLAAQYPPSERTAVLVVPNFPALGKLAAMRFLEWVQENPEGVISLPTGKTPEYFIKEVKRLVSGWKLREVARELEEWGLDPGRPCSLSSLHFVQIDEFYPINPLHYNSFHYYVSRFYLEGFGLDRARALLIDCSRIGLPSGRRLEEVWTEGEVDLSLRYRQASGHQEALQKQTLERIDQWCVEYEERIRALGGIGFFLGGIGPDGHIGFNVRGSDLFSTTRLAPVNYETQAAAASDLGGIEVARRSLVITIGLATITHNPDCTALIVAAGEAKAGIVAASLASPPHVHYPASALQRLRRARFYLTQGAARGLEMRRLAQLSRQPEIGEPEAERILVDLSLRLGRPLASLTEADLAAHPFGAELLRRVGAGPSPADSRLPPPAGLGPWAAARLRARIEEGARIMRDAVFLHTEPHHDDLMLGYLPFIVRHIREHSTRHFFATLTSGFTAVTNGFMLRQCRRLKAWLASEAFQELAAEKYFDPSNLAFRNRDVWRYLDGVAADSAAVREDGEMRRLYRNLAEVYEEKERAVLSNRIDELINYFETQYPGKKDLDHIQRLKGMCREWEADCLWGYFGWSGESVRHLRLGFYTGDIFTEEPTAERDVPPVLRLLREVNPDVVTVALDPEASGPDTHYKVLQATTEALRRWSAESGRSDIRVLGYRNVWFRFHPSEAGLFVPVSLNMFALQASAFLNTFVSQKEASFPSYEHDGPFCELAQKIQVEQYQMLKTCLGREYFYEHPSALIRATRGFVFLKPLSLEQLYSHSRELRRATENR